MQVEFTINMLGAEMETTQTNNFGAIVKKWLPLVVVVALLVAGYFAGLQEYFSLSNIIKHRASIAEFVSGNLIIASLAYMMLYIIVVATSFPGASVLTITSGFIFGVVYGGILTVIGATIGAIVIFLIAKTSFGDFLQAKAGAFINKMIEGFQKNAFQYLLTLRLTPLFPFWVVNIVPAMLNMKLSSYALATLLGIIPGTFAIAYIGAGLDSVIAAQEAVNPGCANAGTCSIDPKALITKDIIFALAGLAFLSFLPFIISKFKGTKTNSAVETASSSK